MIGLLNRISVDYVVFTAAWLVTLWTFRPIWATIQQPNLDRVAPSVIATWLFALCLSLYATFILATVQRAIDGFTGIDFTTRLLAYLSIIAGFYFLIVTLCLILNLPISQHFWKVPIGTGILCIVLTWLNHGQMMAAYDLDVPRTIFAMLLRATIYVYAFVLCVWVWPALIAHFRIEQVPAAQIRIGIMVIGVTAAALLAGTKFITHLGAYWGAEETFIDRWNNIALSFLLIAVCCWVMILFVPGTVYEWIAHPLVALGKMRVLYDLKAVETRLHFITTPIVSLDYSWIRPWTSLDFRIYHTFLNIEDGRQNLIAMLTTDVDAEAEHLHTFAFQQVKEWDVTFRTQADRLYQLFEEHSTTEEYTDRVASYRKIGQVLRKEWQI